MPSQFKVNKIFLDSETVAEQLRSQRQHYGYKLEKAAKELGINIKYLEALEKGDFNSLPSGVYGNNFLREYAMFLKLDPRPLLRLFDAEVTATKEKSQQELFAKQVVKARYFWATPKIIKNLLIAVAVAMCLWFLAYRLEKIVSPPQLTLSSPDNNIITKERSILVKGRAESETELTVNAEAVLLDLQGNFEKQVELKAGINTIIITAEKKFGRKTIVKRQVLVE
jgi:cytoskeletal protein RodZ